MTNSATDHAAKATQTHTGTTRRPARFVAQAAIGGLLMGLANIVPGISGGTMLLATGIYPDFIRAIAEVSRLKFRLSSLVTLASVGGSAALAILLLAGPTKNLVVEHRFIMYSLFIGLTLGGLPIVWRLARPFSMPVGLGGAAGLAVMSLMAFGVSAGDTSGGPNLVLLFVAGLAGASAMILPGISGSYLLLLLGQYVPILSAVDKLKQGLRAGGDLGLIQEGAVVAIPVGLGVVAGIVGVSNLLRWLLEHQRPATLGMLMGLLLGAVLGLWPFQQPRPPEIGSVIRGEVVSQQNISAFEPEDWPTTSFKPNATQIALSVALIGLGFGVTSAIGLLDRQSRGL